MSRVSPAKSSSADEVTKLQQHLSLLRAEYVKLQSRQHELERALATCPTTAADGNESSFASRLLETVAGLFNQESYSDLKVRLPEGEFFAHKFVLAARSEVWRDLVSTGELDWLHLDGGVGQALLRWLYTDELEIPTGDTDSSFTLSLMRASNAFRVPSLLRRCEQSLTCSVEVRNCVRFYAVADEIGAEGLKQHCSELIAANWNDFTSEDFVHLNATLLYKMLKSKTRYPLHEAIKISREDVVFLYLIEFSQQLLSKVNSLDDAGRLPLDLALSSSQFDLADTLLEHRADADAKDVNGRTPLHSAIQRGDQKSSLFLLDHGCDVNSVLEDSLNHPLHLSVENEELLSVTERLIASGARVNPQNRMGLTPLHLSIERDNPEAFEMLLHNGAETSASLCSVEGFPPLWFALKQLEDSGKKEFAERLVEFDVDGALNFVDSDGNGLLHKCALSDMEAAGMFLATQASKAWYLDRANYDGVTVLHLACMRGLEKLTKSLLSLGANANVQLLEHRKTPLHLAVEKGRTNIVDAILNSNVSAADLNLRDADDLTALGLALASGEQHIADALLKNGADVNVADGEGRTLLHKTIVDQKSKGALFLLNNGADVELRTRHGETPIELSVRSGLADVLECLCRKGADMSAASGGDSPLWIALTEDDTHELASVLVRYGVDTDGWGEGPDGCEQTLLHRAIDENREDCTCFLIRAGCDLNSPRRPGPDGQGGEEARDLATPLHLCCQWGLEQTVTSLLEHGVNVNSKDVEGKTPLHIAIENDHRVLTDLLLSSCQSSLDLTARDKSGLTPFAVAMHRKSIVAAKAILTIESQAAEQYDSRGRNFLHSSVMRSDLESVLFLLSVHVDVNSRTQDQNLLTPLLLAVQVGSELIVRNLLLAGASVDARNACEQTALHVAAENDLPSIASVLLSNCVDTAAVDNRGNNALHLAIKEGHLDVVRVLLTESHIDAEAFNHKGRNPLHILAIFAKDNAPTILDLFLECMPQYPINQADTEGNTPLLLAYTKGNGGLCRALVKSGAALGTTNHAGISIFNYAVATKQLLYGLLDFLGQEPKWGEGDSCQECGAKFGITTRRHHCRHCGRLLCSKCSDKDMPIVKYNLSKPVRVCDVCSDVLTIGPGLARS